MSLHASLVGTSRRFSVEEYEQMASAGILRPDEHTELLEGEVVAVSPQGPAHAFGVDALAERLAAAYAGDAFVRTEKPLQLSKHTLAEPDLAVIRGQRRDFRDHHPSGLDTILAIELAWSSQLHDAQKAPLYARAAIPELWLIDLKAESLTVHTRPTSKGYTKASHLALRSPVHLPNTTLSLDLAFLMPT